MPEHMNCEHTATGWCLACVAVFAGAVRVEIADLRHRIAVAENERNAYRAELDATQRRLDAAERELARWRCGEQTPEDGACGHEARLNQAIEVLLDHLHRTRPADAIDARIRHLIDTWCDARKALEGK